MSHGHCRLTQTAFLRPVHFENWKSGCSSESGFRAIRRDGCSPGISVEARGWKSVLTKSRWKISHVKTRVAFTGRIPNSYLSVRSISMATVVVTAALGTVTFRLGVGRPILAIAILMVRRWDGKRVGGAGSHVPTPTHH
jgi:hypothetical protein